MAKAELRLDLVAHKPARLACERWHYSHCAPIGKLVRVGVWEDGRFIGVVIFSRGANPSIQGPWGVDMTEICELTRIALRQHRSTVSRIVRVALKILRATNPGIRLVVSYADPAEGHHGGIYQASNFVYTGTTGTTKQHFAEGKWRHPRAIYAPGFGGGAKKGAVPVPNHAVRVRPGKHRYVFALDRTLQPIIERSRVIDLPKRPEACA